MPDWHGFQVLLTRLLVAHELIFHGDGAHAWTNDRWWLPQVLVSPDKLTGLLVEIPQSQVLCVLELCLKSMRALLLGCVLDTTSRVLSRHKQHVTRQSG